MIQPGQLLKVPPGVAYYVVQAGDTLYQIAKRFNVTTGSQSNFERIREINRLPSYNLYPEMKLIIPYAPPGDNGLIAYVSNRGGGYDLWMYNPSNGIDVQLTVGLGESYSVPYWSMDNNKIAFIGKNRILYVFKLANHSISRIDQFADGVGVYVDWSPESEELVYSKQDGIVLYNIRSHQAERINHPGTRDVQFLVTDKEFLFEAQDETGVSQLYRIRRDGTAKRQITQNTGGPLNHVRLSPDGTFALYTTPGASISIIHTVEISTGTTYVVEGGPLAKNYFPEWSPDSTTIAYSATAFEEQGYFSQIRTTGKHGESDRTIAISNCFGTPVTWSENGRKLAYLSGCENQDIASEIWIIDVNHAVPIRVVEGVHITSLQWSQKAPAFIRKTYTNTVYQVQFKYPEHWQKVTDGRYEGTDGFFQISAIFSDEPIDQVCHNEAFQQLLPYGKEPRIVKTEIQNQEACFIFPSQDQPQEMRNQAALIIRYPIPIVLEGTTYNYFILWADQDHVVGISRTLLFIL